MRTLRLVIMASCLATIASVICIGQDGSAIRVAVLDDQGRGVRFARAQVIGHPELIGLPAPDGTFTFKHVPPGTYQIRVDCAGFREKTINDVLAVEGKTTDWSIKLEAGPPKASDVRTRDTAFTPFSYSDRLKSLGEPTLCEQPISEGTQRYRFLWVPTFSHPVFLRIDFGADGEGTLLTVVWNGAGGYDWGKPDKKVRKLTWDEDRELFEVLADVGFWTLPSEVDRPPGEIVLDGTEWFVEGVKDGDCHAVTRYSTPLTELFQSEFLAQIAKLKPYYGQNH